MFFSPIFYSELLHLLFSLYRLFLSCCSVTSHFKRFLYLSLNYDGVVYSSRFSCHTRHYAMLHMSADLRFHILLINYSLNYHFNGCISMPIICFITRPSIIHQLFEILLNSLWRMKRDDTYKQTVLFFFSWTERVWRRRIRRIMCIGI